MAMDGLDREHVYELFEKAVKDYICKFPMGVVQCVPQWHPASVSAIMGCVVRCYCPEKSISLAIGKIGVQLLPLLSMVFNGRYLVFKYRHASLADSDTALSRYCT